MNSWHDEYMAEYNRQRIIATAEQIRLENLVLKSRVHHPTRFERMMFNLGNWMIATGRQIRQRYEIPVSHCSGSHFKGFAH